jgi:hypothetical protein
MNEEQRREANRIRTLKGGTIVFNNGNSVLNCVIRDVSATGARLQVDGGAILPDQFLLVTGPWEQRQERAVRVVWRARGQLGVVFI